MVTASMEWQAFDYQDFEEGLMWVLVQSPEYDCDVDDSGHPIGTPTGTMFSQAVLVFVSEYLGMPDFDSVDPVNHGAVGDDSLVTHYMPLIRPALPTMT